MKSIRPALIAAVTLCFFFLPPVPPAAAIGICDHAKEYCGHFKGNRSSSSPAYPSTNASININPSAVPTDKGLGVETIHFKGEWDFALVKGLGRVGAAISPSNNEETFFGPPGFELPEDFLRRKEKQLKYPSQKFTLATAFNIFDNKKKGLQRFELNLGVVGKYNRFTSTVLPGGGLSGVFGPITFGYSVYRDSYQLDYARYGLDWKPEIRYTVETYSLGLSLNSLALDYSVLRLDSDDDDSHHSGSHHDNDEVPIVSVATASLILRRAIATVSIRQEISDRPVYNSETRSLETKKVKGEIFGGAQVAVTEFLMLGAFYNYYVLREISVGATLFF